MAIIRRETIPNANVHTKITDIIAETAADLLTEDAQRIGIGSMAYCLADKNIYVKRTNGTWGVAMEVAE